MLATLTAGVLAAGAGAAPVTTFQNLTITQRLNAFDADN